MQNRTFHVILLEKKGFKYSIWLPDKKEGKYVFSNARKGVIAPVHIIGKDDSWYVVVNGDIYSDIGKSENNCCKLDEHTFMEIRTTKSEYILYVENIDDANRLYLPYVFDTESEIVVGRDLDCDVIVANPRISRKHFRIYRKNNGVWILEDLGSLNGTYLNSELVSVSVVKPGDNIYVMGLSIICGVNYFAMNNADEKAKLNTKKIKLICDSNELEFDAKEENADSLYFERNPRKSYKLITNPIELEAPPMSMKGGKVPFLLRMGNSMIYGGGALLSGNVLMATTSLLLPGITQGLTEKERREYEEKRVEIYTRYLDAKKQEIKQEKKREEEHLNYVYPALANVLDFVENKERLWERRKYDNDFLTIRIGYGNIPLISEIKYPPKRLEVDRDELSEKMYELVEKKHVIENVPILVELAKDFFIGVKGDILKKIDFVSNLILQLAFSHSYDEVKIVLLGDESISSELDFIKYIPHNWNNERDFRFFAETRSDAQQLASFFNKEIEKNKGYDKKDIVKKSIHYVTIAFDKDLYDCVEAFKTISGMDEYFGISLIAAFDNVPKECKKLISLNDKNLLIDLHEPENENIEFKVDKCLTDKVRHSLEKLNKTKLNIDEESFSLPTNVDFLGMYGINNVEYLNPLKRWNENDPTISLAAPVGIGGDGKPFILDLHEKKQGPHGLIAGGTGSGKSEFIISYVLSMAINYSPDEVSFVLIDYKGGGLADAFVDKKKGIHLPHVVATITNLDGASVSRSLLAINSEIKRRQNVFKKAKSDTEEGTMDIYDYQKLYRSGKVLEPMPHLIIISDEFAELKKQEPEFMDELISIARIGRSLGVHLILATQKPAGVVNEQIWSNTKFRVCLKVASKNDSFEMLKRHEAAEIKNTGRFYLQVGYNDYFAMGQAGWCGAGYYPGDDNGIESEQVIEFVDNVGQEIFVAKQNIEKKQSECKQVVAIVKHLSKLAQQEKIIPKQLWCDTLPKKIDLKTLIENHENKGKSISAVIGVFDDPENQKQFDFELDMMKFHHMLIVGPSGSGKSVYLRSLLYSLAFTYSPEDVNFYLADFSRGALADFSELSHCGAYITESDERNFERLLNMISDIAARRKQMYLDEHVTTFEGYRKIKPLPLILVIIDGYSMIKPFKKFNDFHVNLCEYMKLGASYGIKFIVTLERYNDIYSKAKQEADYNIAFQGKDKYDYMEILGKKCQIVPPVMEGRGVAIFNEKPLEFHTGMSYPDLNEFEASKKLRESLTEINLKWSGYVPAEGLTVVKTGEKYDEFLKDFCKGRIPLGYSLKDLRRVAMPLKQFHSMSVYIGNESAKSPFIESILLAAEMNEMKVVFMKKTINSFMDVNGNRERFNNLECMQVTEENMIKLSKILFDELVARNIPRDEFCEQNNIPKDFNGKAIAARDYIMSKTKPLLVFFEAFGELCRLDETDVIRELVLQFETFFGHTQGYNIYFVGMTFPDDDIAQSGFLRVFNPEQFCLLLGGRYDKQCIISNLPFEIKKETKVKVNYDEVYMKYRDEIHLIKMPLGELIELTEDEDLVAIV